MKKFYLTIMFLAFVGFLSAQQKINTEPVKQFKKEVSEISDAKLQQMAKAEMKRIAKRNANTSKVLKTRWYNAAFTIDALNGGASVASANNIFPDTTILVDYGTSGYSGTWIHSIGECFDPQSAWFDPITGTELDIPSFAPYRVDSIGMYALYYRGTAASVVDTLLIQIRQSTGAYRYWANHSHFLTNYNADTVAFRPVPYDQYKYYSTDMEVTTFKIPLTAASEFDTLASGWNYFAVAPQNYMIDPGKEVIVTWGFIPGYTWTPNVDTLTSKNRLRFISFEENGADTYPVYTKWEWTNSYIQNDDDLFEANPTSYTSMLAYMAGYGYEHHWVEVKLEADVNDGISSIDENGLSLGQNRPNPANSSTTIDYTLSKNFNDVVVTVYDICGKVVYEVEQGNQAAGNYSVNLNTSDFANGSYFYSLTADGVKTTKKMMIVK